MPVIGGWDVIYTAPDLKMDFKARGSRPQGILQLIVSHRIANDLPPDPDGVRFFLENEWYRRDPKRFVRPPRKVAGTTVTVNSPARKCDQTAWFGSFCSMLNAAASSGSKQGVILATQCLQDLIKGGRFNCKECDIFITKFMRSHRLEHLNSPTKVQDWAWEFQSQLAKHLGMSIPPREVVESQWCWPSTT